MAFPSSDKVELDCWKIYSVFGENFAIFLLIAQKKMVDDDRVLCIEID